MRYYRAGSTRHSRKRDARRLRASMSAFWRGRRPDAGAILRILPASPCSWPALLPISSPELRSPSTGAIPRRCELLRPMSGVGSAQFLRAAQACDHGNTQQVLVGAVLVGCDLGEGAPELEAVRFEIALVLDRLLLDVFQRDQPPLAVIALELGLRLFAAPDLHHARGQIDGVVDAAVHAHAAERIVDMR